MRSGLPKILITGGAGFIGSAFVRLTLKEGYKVIVLDKLTYAGDLARLKEVKGRFKFYKVDICNQIELESILTKERPQIILNFAASTHVDRSIQDARSFIDTNIKGTQVLLDASMRHNIKRVIHISTDEVYGEIEKGEFREDSPLKPNSPYAASKAAADLLIKSYTRTYAFPAIIIRPCNTYGPWQYPEKLIPLAILKILRNEKIPVYGNGKNIREWLYIDDCVKGILNIIREGKVGEIYNLGSGQEKKNLDTVKAILGSLNKDDNLIGFVKDRPGHDIRYSLNSTKIFKEIGWQSKISFAEGLKNTIDWYIWHKDWLLSKWRNISPLYEKH